MVAPFQYPGSKHRVAPVVWDALGDPPRYIEPFAGSLGVLLARPGQHDGYGELLGDASGHVVNVWRAIRAAPAEVARHLAGPSSAADLAARHRWTHTEGVERVAAVFSDPHHYDAQAAAWFVYGLNFAVTPRAFMEPGEQPGRPHKNVGQGHHAEWRQPLDRYLEVIAARLSRAVIFAGDWTACVTPAALRLDVSASVGVFLDPPYGLDRRADLYGVDSFAVAADVLAWCAEHGGDRRLRIVLAGYSGEHDQLEAAGWRCRSWSSATGSESRHSERLWCSPHCLNPAPTLWESA